MLLNIGLLKRMILGPDFSGRPRRFDGLIKRKPAGCTQASKSFVISPKSLGAERDKVQTGFTIME